MTPEAIQSVLQMKPFRPFRIHSGSGRVYPVRDPNLVQITATTLTLLAAGPGEKTSRVADIDIASVSTLTLDASSAETP